MRAAGPIGQAGLALLLAAAATVLPQHARAQVEGQYFSMKLPTVTSTTSYEIEDEERTTRFLDIEEHTNTFSQELEIETEGWVYHPALAIFSLNLQPKLELESTEASGGIDRSNRILFFGYTFGSTIFQYKPYTFNLYSSRSRSDFDNSLASDSVTESAIDRGTLRLKYDPLPTSISVERSVLDFEGFNDYKEVTKRARTDSRHVTDNSTSFLATEFARQERDTDLSSIRTDRALLSASNFYRFDPDTRLSSSVRASKTMSDAITSTSYSLAEGLFLRHNPNLTSDYQGRFEHRDETNNFSKILFGSGRVQHELYENLTTTLLAEVEDEDFTGGELRTYEGDLDFRYRRPIPWGRIGLSNGYAVRLEDSRTGIDFIEVRDESHVLTGTSLAFLNRIDIDSASILVTDNTGLTVFTEGVDYNVTVAGSSVAISRTIASAIVSGATVLVDYRFAPAGTFSLYNTTIRGGANAYLWNMWRVYYDFTRSADHMLSGRRPTTLTNDTIHRMGSELNWRWTRTQFEYEQRNTTRTPLTKWTARETLTFRPLPDFWFSLGASYGETDLKETGQKSTNQEGNANAQWRPFRWGTLEVRSTARRVRGDLQRTNDVDILSRFRWQWGFWSGSIKFEFRKQNDFLHNQRRKRRLIFFELVRRFET